MTPSQPTGVATLPRKIQIISGVVQRGGRGRQQYPQILVCGKIDGKSYSCRKIVVQNCKIWG